MAATTVDTTLRPYDLSGQRILLSGAFGGIGRATATLLAHLGATLLLTDRADAPDFVAGLRQDGRDHRFIACDVTAKTDIEALCGEAGPLDAAILNAGIFPRASWDDDAWEREFDQVMAINLKAPAHFARCLLPGMKQRGSGRIVLIGSIAAYTGGSFTTSPVHYAMTKGAIHTMLRWMAKRAAPEVLVNAIAPGTIETPMTAGTDRNAMKANPLPRLGKPEEIAWPIAFLCSPGASFMCGAILDVNGGAYLRP